MNKQNILSKLSSNALKALNMSEYIAKEMFSKEITVEHLFTSIVLLKESLASRTLHSIGINIDNILRSIVGEKEINISLSKLKKVEELSISEDIKAVIRSAFRISSKYSHVYVGTEHLMGAILKGDSELNKKLKENNLDYKVFEQALINYATYPIGILSKPGNIVDNGQEQSALKAFGKDLVELASQGRLDPVIGREIELEKIINILSRRKKNNPIIVGESGVGKTALVEALAQRIADGNVPAILSECRIISLDVPGIMAGSKMRGDVEEKMMAIVKEVESSPDVILFIDEIHNILNSGIPGGQSDIVAVLKPALTRNEFRCIGATTSVEYRQYFEEDNALVRRFQPVNVSEPSVLDTIQILKRIKPVLESHHGVRIEKEAIEAAVKLSNRYVTERFLPDKSIDLLDEAAATKKLEAEAENGNLSELLTELRTIQLEKDSLIKKDLMDEANKLFERELEVKKEIKKWEKKKNSLARSKEFEVDVDTIRKVVSRWTGIPVTTLGSDEKSTLRNIDKAISKRVVGQKEAIKSVSDAVKRARTGISDEGRPWASLLFLGPTGVGKSELAKALTKELFGDEDRLIQIDMSELMEMHSVSKLIGSPPGYVGYREGGQLTERIRQNPHSVVLFDEIEKAHPDVLNILLQILEYGHLTDSKGRKVDFKNCVVILTSNIGADEIRKDKVLGFVAEREETESADMDQAYLTMKDTLTKELKDRLKPELINRLDDIIIFRSLSKEDAFKIVDILVEQLNKRLKEVGIKVHINDRVREYIVKEGFSDEYGARPLRRMLQDHVENILAEYILSNKSEEQEKMLEVNLDLVGNKIKIIK